MGLEAGIWASRLGFEGEGRRRRRRGRKSPICVKAWVIDPFGAAAKTDSRETIVSNLRAEIAGLEMTDQAINEHKTDRRGLLRVCVVEERATSDFNFIFINDFILFSSLNPLLFSESRVLRFPISFA